MNIINILKKIKSKILIPELNQLKNLILKLELIFKLSFILRGCSLSPRQESIYDSH